MYILNISDDINQEFSFSGENYNTTIVLKCGEELSCSFLTPPVMDVFVDGYPPVLGVPLLNGVDVLGKHTATGCLPYDYGAIMVLSNNLDDFISCRDILEGNAALLYFSPVDIIISSLSFAGLGEDFT